jgi:hypothetical protein
LLRHVPSIWIVASYPSSGKLGARDTDGAAGDLQHVACSGAHTQQIGWRQSRNGAADVLDARLGNAQYDVMVAARDSGS